MDDPFDENSFTDQELEFLEYARQMSDDEQKVMLRTMQFMAADSNHEYKSDAKLAELLEAMKRRH